MEATPIITVAINHFGQKLTIHGISTGQVKVKRSHRNPSLGLPLILADPAWTDWMPIMVWVIEHPEGIMLVDTGENSRTTTPGYFDCDPVTGWINKQILRFQVTPSLEIDRQLEQIGIQPSEVRWVILTHMHLDHVDGLHHFSQAEIVVSQTELNRPFGAMPCLLPKGFRPTAIHYQAVEGLLWGEGYPLTKQADIYLIPSPGHTYGHQSILLRSENVDICFAGDLAFSQQQLLTNKIGGIVVDKRAARRTYEQVKTYASQRPLVVLPSHDPEAGSRLQSLSTFPPS